MTRVLDVWWDGRIAGRLTQDPHGALGFAYSPDWLHDADARALSVSLPKREELFSRRECRPFFGGLLPEESQRDAVIFNLIAGNADAHGKNFSILHDETGPRFAPLYDLLATVAYPELSSGLAMKIGRRAILERMDIGAWARFAADAGLGLPLVRRRVAEISTGARVRAEEVAGTLMRPGIDAEVLTRIAELVADRAQRCASTVRGRPA